MHRGTFFRWCRPPVVARLYVPAEDAAPGGSLAVMIEKLEECRDIFHLLDEPRQRFTILLNRVECVSRAASSLRDALEVGRSWRWDDIVATLSTAGSGIGFHAGHEDGFIVQLKGRRQWSVWPADDVELTYRRSLLGDKNWKQEKPPPRPASQPLLQCELGVGDVLYIPALYGHEGVTLEESLSLSIGWRGLCAYHLFQDLMPERLSGLESFPPEFFDLLPDPDPNQPETADALLSSLSASLRLLGLDARPETVKSLLLSRLQSTSHARRPVSR